jgi:hypothetical protein
VAVARLEITRRSPFAFDYERIDGVLHFAVDPQHPANARIVDLDRARRDADGKVTFSADFLLLQPRDAARANRRLLSYVVNRGQRVGVPFNRFGSREVTVPPTDEIDPGDGFLMRHGWTVAMCGWQWDVRRQPGLLGLDAPQALGPDGQPVHGRVVVGFQPNEAHRSQLLAHWPLHPPPGRLAFPHRQYPAADVDEPDATLTVRDAPLAEPTTIPRERWHFARDYEGSPLPDDSYVWLQDGFQPGKWYDVTYTTRICPVVGAGLLATRDSVSWLRNEYERPFDFTYGYGISQCGRFLRQYLYDGLNVDEAGRQVFDGVIPHVAGARRGQFNHRYAQPSDTHPRGAGSLYPFASDALTDPETGQTDGLLKRQRAVGGVPRIFTTNTSSEYWRSDCSLIHTDPSGTRDVGPPAEERIYLIAGHKHGAGDATRSNSKETGARAANDFNVVDGSTVIRAFLVNLDRWVSAGLEPPPSSYPRLDDGTAVPREDVLQQLSALPGLTLLDAAVMPRMHRLDPGLPDGIGAPFISYAPAVDADGNEVAGIRLPDLTVPVATHTGWVARHPATGGVGQLLDMMGTSMPFATSDDERQANGDPRAALTDRYPDREQYRARVRAQAEKLAAARYVLEEDVDVVVELALERFDLFARELVAQGAGGV